MTTMTTSANKHISIPKTFSSGDVDEWFCRFEICSKANDWNAATQAAKLPTLLEGEALAVWLELSEEDKGDYSKAKKGIKTKLLPTAFSALDKFNRRSMLPGETLHLFLHDLKRLLDQAMPDLPAAAREQLLLHQFLTELPAGISKQLRSTGDTKCLDTTVERARLLMTLENDHELKDVASVSREDANYGENCEMMQLKTQLGELTEQVAALTAVQSTKRVSRAPRCFSCQRLGHFQRQCPNQRIYQAWAADNR